MYYKISFCHLPLDILGVTLVELVIACFDKLTVGNNVDKIVNVPCNGLVLFLKEELKIKKKMSFT